MDDLRHVAIFNTSGGGAIPRAYVDFDDLIIELIYTTPYKMPKVTGAIGHYRLFDGEWQGLAEHGFYLLRP